MTPEPAATEDGPLRDEDGSQDQIDKTWDDQLAKFRKEARQRLRERRDDGRLHIKNRRKRYLDLHPEYFKDPVHRIAQCALHDHLIMPHMSQAELITHFTNLITPAHEENYIEEWEDAVKKEACSKPTTWEGYDPGFVMRKSEAHAAWVDELTQRFLRGEDSAFDYSKVDHNDAYIDPDEERDRDEDLYGIIDDETEGWETMSHENGTREYDY